MSTPVGLLTNREERRHRAGERGTALLEFVLTLPILLTFFALVVYLGYALAHRQAMEFAAGQGAFAASLYPVGEALARARGVVEENQALAPPALGAAAQGDCPRWRVETTFIGSGDEPLPRPGGGSFPLNGLQNRTDERPPYLQVVVTCRVVPPLPVFLKDLAVPVIELRVERVGRLGCWRQLTDKPCL